MDTAPANRRLRVGNRVAIDRDEHRLRADRASHLVDPSRGGLAKPRTVAERAASRKRLERRHRLASQGVCQHAPVSQRHSGPTDLYHGQREGAGAPFPPARGRHGRSRNRLRRAGRRCGSPALPGNSGRGAIASSAPPFLIQRSRLCATILTNGRPDDRPRSPAWPRCLRRLPARRGDRTAPFPPVRSLDRAKGTRCARSIRSGQERDEMLRSLNLPCAAPRLTRSSRRARRTEGNRVRRTRYHCRQTGSLTFGLRRLVRKASSNCSKKAYRSRSIRSVAAILPVRRTKMTWGDHSRSAQTAVSWRRSRMMASLSCGASRKGPIWAFFGTRKGSPSSPGG